MVFAGVVVIGQHPRHDTSKHVYKYIRMQHILCKSIYRSICVFVYLSIYSFVYLCIYFATNIHLPTILMFTRVSRAFDPTAPHIVGYIPLIVSHSISSYSIKHPHFAWLISHQDSILDHMSILTFDG